MPRTQKRRRICGLPQFNEFSPENGKEQDAVYLTLDEYEAIRLIDLVGLKQEEAAEKMQISRTSVTAVYEKARHQIAQALVNGRKLYITGGCCSIYAPHIKSTEHTKGENEMRIAVTYENGEVFQHFGRTPGFKFYDIEDKQIVDSKVVSVGESGHGALAGLLAAVQTDILLCGGMGMGAQYALADAGVNVFAGISGDADEAVRQLIAGTLEYTQTANCDHHAEEGCGCGEHEEGCGCGEHSGGCGCGHNH